MLDTAYTLKTLFEQLGLESSDAAVERFIESHRPLPPSQRLQEAPFWTPSQAKLLGEAVAHDADWAVVVDQLDSLLRKPE